MKPHNETELLIPGHVVEYYAEKQGDDYDAEATQVLFIVRALAQRVNDVSSIWLAPFGLTPLSYQVLARLQAEPTRALLLSAITKSLHTRAATMTALIDGLERDGIIKRAAHATDRRATLATLTAKGSRLAAKVTASQHLHIKRIMAAVSSRERQTVLNVLLEISAGLKSEKLRLQDDRSDRADIGVKAARSRPQRRA